MRFYVRSFLGIGLFFFAWAAFEYSIYQVLQIGTCASGGPYVSARECPSGTGIYFAGLFGGIVLGLIAVGIYATRGTPPDAERGDYQGPRVPFGILAWSLLFLGTAAVGLVSVIHGHPGPGAKTGAIIVAAVFVPMGAIPVLFSLRSRPRSTSSPSQWTPPPAPAGGGPLGYSPAPPPPPMPRPTPVSVPQRPAAKPHPEGLGRLEKLKKLHDEGALTDAEFSAAKAKVLNEL